jgi:hypothetical protein
VIAWPPASSWQPCWPVTATWSWVLLSRSASWYPWLRFVIVLAAVAAAGLVLAWPWLAAIRVGRRATRWLTVAPLSLALAAGLGGPLAYSISTAATSYTGANARPAGARRRNAGHHRRPAEGAARRRPGDLLRRRAEPVSAGRPRQRVRSGRLKPIFGAVRPLAEAPSAFAPDRRVPGKTIIRVTEGG